MLDHEKKLQILDITVVCVLFLLGGFVGKLVTENMGDTWFSFNGPTLGILIIGELIWWRVRKSLIKKWEDRGV